jgi:hypothetical protein
LTAEVFFRRLREAQAKTEDFDEVVAEFGRGCPCKEPPLKSKGKTHLKSLTHDRAFNHPTGAYFGMSVRAAFEAQGQQRPYAPLPPIVVHVPGSQRIGDADADEDESADNYWDNPNEYFEMEDIPEGSEIEVVSRQVPFGDEDVGDIQVQGE